MMNSVSASSDIAIVGMSALFPQAENLQVYWQNILNKVDAITKAPDNWALSFCDPQSTENDRIYTRLGGFLGELAEFNPLDFGIMPNSIDGGEPDHFLALRLASQALQDAGYLDKDFNRERTGIILGRGTYVNRGYDNLLQHGQIVDQTLDILHQLLPELDRNLLGQIRSHLKSSLPPFTAEVAPGFVPNVITGRIANRLDFKGPNYIVDAACSSSLVAVDAAIRELQSDRCDLMLTGGVHASTPPQINMVFCMLKALSHGKLRPFSSNGDGTLLGEGMGILVLKRLADAERDNDRIYALLKGVGSSSDGKALGLLAPRMEGEVIALERAYTSSKVDPKSVGLIEAHGTGIPLGDQTEFKSLSQLFGSRTSPLPTCAVGSVKSMIGHCIPAAGSASLIKVVLALYHKVLPPTLCEEINPELEIHKTPFYINTETRPWIHGKTDSPRRAGVNSFGFGGVNTHAIVEEYTGTKSKPLEQLHKTWTSELLMFQAQDLESLHSQVEKLQEFMLNQLDFSLADLAYTLATNISDRGQYRLALVVSDQEDCQKKIKQILSKLADHSRQPLKTRGSIYFAQGSSLANSEKTALLFPGEGSQYPNMLADLCLYFPQVRAWFDFLDRTFGEQRDSPPSSFIFPPPSINLTSEEQLQAQQKLFSMDLASETVFIASLALHELLTSLGVKGKIAVGHSTGESTALVASNTIKLENKEELSTMMQHLNQIYQNLAGEDAIPKGALLSVGAVSSEFLQQLLGEFSGRIHLAMHNCPNQAIIFGSQADIELTIDKVKAVGGICSLLPFDRAYHTPLFKNVSQAFQSFYDAIKVGSGNIRLYSCVKADYFSEEPAEIRALAAQQWSNCVRFSQTIETLFHNEGIRTFVEVGPSSNLTGFVNDVLRKQEYLALSSNHQRKSGLAQLQNLLASLFVHGASLNFSPLYQHRNLNYLDWELSKSAKLDKKQPNSCILDLTMPVMSLSPEFVEEVRAKVLGRREVISNSSAPIPLNSLSNSSQPKEQLIDNPLPSGNYLEADLETDLRSPQSAPLSSLESGSLSSFEVSNPDLSVSDAGQLSFIHQHFDLMRTFLDSHSRISSQLFDNHIFSQPDNSIEDRASEKSTSTNIEHSNRVNPFPLIGQIRQQGDGFFYSERLFTLEEDIFLYDHTIGGKLSNFHPELNPLPVIPFTVSLEVIAEAAVYLTDNQYVVIGMENMRGYRWLSLDRDALLLGIEAQRLSEQESHSSKVQVKFFQYTNNDVVDRHLVFEGTVNLAVQFPNPPSPMAFTYDSWTASRWSDSQLYQTGMFHGPRFQGVTHIRGWNKQEIEAELKVIEIDDFFQTSPPPIFQIDPGLLDAAGQLVGYWVLEQSEPDFNVFPFRVTAFQQYRPPLAAGSVVICRGFIEFVSDSQTTANFDFFDQDGQVIARLSGWQDRYYRVPLRYYECRLHPTTAYLSNSCASSKSGYVCRRIEPFSERFLNDSWGIWKRVLAHLILNTAERDYWYQLPDKGLEQVNWLLGIITVKDGIREWAEKYFQLALAPVDIEILSTSAGTIYARCPQIEEITNMPAISFGCNENGEIFGFCNPPILSTIDSN